MASRKTTPASRLFGSGTFILNGLPRSAPVLTFSVHSPILPISTTAVPSGFFCSPRRAEIIPMESDMQTLEGSSISAMEPVAASSDRIRRVGPARRRPSLTRKARRSLAVKPVPADFSLGKPISRICVRVNPIDATVSVLPMPTSFGK